jgi:DNA polymerase III delta prime subunit
MNNKVKLEHVESSKLKVLLTKYTKPVLILGPVGCGRCTAVKQIAESLGQELYFLGNINNHIDFIGIDNKEGEDVPSNFLLAYLNGGVLFVDDVSKRKFETIKQLIELSKKDSININKKKIEKNKNFKIVLSCDIENDMIVNFIEKKLLDDNEVISIKFNYDEKLEKNLCDDKDFYDFFMEIRKMNEGSIYNVSTTSAIVKCNKLLKSPAFTTEDIIGALFVNGYNYEMLDNLYNNCKHLGFKNRFVLELKNILTLH